MTPANSSDTFSFDDPEDYPRFWEVLKKAGFTQVGVVETLGVKDFPSLRGDDLPILLRRTNRNSPLDVLIRLFLIEVAVELKAARQALQPMRLEILEQAGLIRIDGGSAIARVKMLPYQNLVIAYDPPWKLKEQAQDYVMGLGSSSITLANLTLRKRVSSALDLGTGCGIQALLAARHSDRVLAVDLNPRAVQIASFNARLNGLLNVECLEGNLFEPLQGSTFDLVISNPPFVISPGTQYLYRDSGMEGDEICQKIVREVPRFLREGGYCQMMCNWVEKPGESWHRRLAGWFENTGCDAWVMRSETRDIETYAATWIRHTELQAQLDVAERFEEWMTYYNRLSIEAISAGVIMMRRRDGYRNWFWADESPEKMLGPTGDAIMLGFELHDFLETVQDDSVLLGTRLYLSPDISLERQYEPSSEGWKEVTAQIEFKKGLAYSGKVDPCVAQLLIGCNGQRRVADLLNEVASTLGSDSQTITSPLCEVIRRLIERGFLIPEHLITKRRQPIPNGYVSP